MTEDEWFGTSRPRDMLRLTGQRASLRQQRLIAAAAVRLLPPGLLGPTAAGWLDAIDRLAERPGVRVSQATLRRERASWPEDDESERGMRGSAALYQALRGQVEATLVNVGFTRGTCSHPAYDLVDPDLAAIVRDVIGNPFRSVAFDRRWRTEPVVGLARQMYEARDFGPMPVLADALDDAGCDAAEVLAHCRGDGPHARGCWVVDLILGRS